jgi:hypothetical protein
MPDVEFQFPAPGFEFHIIDLKDIKTKYKTHKSPEPGFVKIDNSGFLKQTG